MTSYPPGGPAIPLTITVPGTTYQTWGYQLNARMASNLAGAGGFFTAGDNGSTSGFGPSSTFTINWTPPPAGTTDSVNFYLTGNNTSSFSGSNLFSTGMYMLTPAAAAVAPSISTQPANQTMTAGQTATFSVAATGTAPLGYQWRKNGANMTGATSSSYTTTATTTADSNSTFSVVVTNSAGTATSNNATLTVNTATAAAAPSITTQPASRTVAAGQTASFSVAATGTTPLTYQWSKNAMAVSGATSSSYTTPATTTSDTGSLFSVVVTNAAGSATSNAATLTVNSTISTSPMVVSPTSLTFNYQSGGSTSGTQSLTITSSGGRYYYWVSTSGGTWLTASPTSGRTPGTITVSVNASGMSSGTYSGTIQVRADDVGGKTVPVTLIVTASACVTNCSGTGTAIYAAPYVYDPTSSGGLYAQWIDNIGVPTGNPTSPFDPGLELSKNATSPTGSFTGAYIRNIQAGSPIPTEVGFDYREGGQCTTTSPRVEIVASMSGKHV